jgi:hypothetical protein
MLYFFILGDFPASEFLCVSIGGVRRKNVLPAYTIYEDGTDSLPKRRHIKIQTRQITQNKEYKTHTVLKY